MGFLNRVGNLFGSAIHRLGNINVHSVLERVGQIASAGHKLTSLANVVTGGAVRHAAERVIGKPATDAVAHGGKYLATAYDSHLVAKAALGAPQQQMTYGGAGGSASAVKKSY